MEYARAVCRMRSRQSRIGFTRKDGEAGGVDIIRTAFRRSRLIRMALRRLVSDGRPRMNAVWKTSLKRRSISARS